MPVLEVHNSDLYGNFIEIGAAQPLATVLFSTPGSSSTVNMAIFPYSKQSQTKRYGLTSYRNVSREYVEYMLEMEKMLNTNLEINFIWVSSFQLDDCAHGWIAYEYKNKKSTFHVTLPNSTRAERIVFLSEISLQILEYAVAEKTMDIKYIDGIWSTEQNVLNINMVEYYHVINPKGGWERLETQFRNNKESIIIYKGSFNPMHKGHMAIVTHCQKKYQNSPIGLMISMNTHEKGEIKNIEKRIEKINDKKLSAIITEKGLFKENIEELNNRLPNQNWIFPIGYDTYKKMEKELFEYKNVKYIVFNRDNKINFDKPEYDCCEYVKLNIQQTSSNIRKGKSSNIKKKNTKH